MVVPLAKKMQIAAYSDENFSSSIGTFSVWVNPSTYSYKTKVLYRDRQGQGSNGPSPRFNKICDENVSFDLLFDATGALPEPDGADYAGSGITNGISQFMALTTSFNGQVHRPNYLTLSWADLQFDCVLTSLDITYTLFRPDGTPIRAKMKVAFQSFTSQARLAREAAKSSPDLTHVVTTVVGDTLPLLCYRIYGDSGFYREVAEVNGLTDFRRLEPGRQLQFPPLRGSA